MLSPAKSPLEPSPAEHSSASGRADDVPPNIVVAVREQLLEEGSEISRETISLAARRYAGMRGEGAFEAMVNGLHSELAGAGPLQMLLDDPDVTDVLVNGPEEVWTDGARGQVLTGVRIGTESDLRDLAVRLAAAAGQRLDDAMPRVDGQLADGTRLHALLAPLVDHAAVVSLRVPRAGTVTVTDLVERRAMPPSWQPVVEALLDRRLSFLVSGPTGAGKTTVLGALLGRVPASERILIIEEARELRPHHPHVVSLVARRANAEGVGGVGLTELVREALRMRPDRIVLGECRGAEVRDMLTALNTGHEGGCATIHANAAADVPARLIALGMLAGLPAEVVEAQAACALEVVIHVAQSSGVNRHRYLAEIAVFERRESGELVAVPALTWDGAGETQIWEHWGLLARRLGLANE